MRLEARLYEANLLQRQRSIDVFAMQAKWRAVPAGDDDEHLYGRPVAFYQQLQELNLEREWSQVRVPVLAMHSEYDWIIAATTTNGSSRWSTVTFLGGARFVELPATGHTFEHYENTWRDYPQ